MIDAKWIGDSPEVSRPAVMLVAILDLSNAAERMQDPFTRRIALNELQTAIQGAKTEIEAFAEGMIFSGDDSDA